MIKKKTKTVIKKTSLKKKQPLLTPRLTRNRKLKAARAKKISLPRGQRIVVREIKEEAPSALFQAETQAVSPEAVRNFNFDLAATSFAAFEINDEVEEQEQEQQQEESLEQESEQEELLTEELMVKSEGNEMTPRQKSIIMYTSIVTIMSVVVVFWIFAVRNSLSENLQSLQIANTNSVSQNQIGQKWEDVKAELSNFKNSIGQQGQVIGDFTSQIKTQIIAGFIKDAAANKIKTQLENLNVKANNVNQDLNTNSVQ